MTTTARQGAQPPAQRRPEIEGHGQRYRWIVPFADGGADQADRLGGKGAGLAEMTKLGLPVPPGFTIVTAACREYRRTGKLPEGLEEEIDRALAEVETASGRRFGHPTNPLLVSVRSGARFSMPGMMDTVLDLGLDESVLEGLAARTTWHFALDCRRRQLQMWARSVAHLPDTDLASALTAALSTQQVESEADLDVEGLRYLTNRLEMLLRHHGAELPQPREQLLLAVAAVFESWDSERARAYRAARGIPEELGTAVNIQAMVYGNRSSDSGSGVCFTRNPATGSATLFGDFLACAQGEDVVAGTHHTLSLAEMSRTHPEPYAALADYSHVLERHYRDMCDIEFTVEEGRLWVLQTRIGQRSAAAAFRIAIDLVDEQVITLDEALRRVDGVQLEQLLHDRFAPGDRQVLAVGRAASPGASVGEIVCDRARAVERAQQGRAVVLVRPETAADDLPAMLSAVAVVTTRGGLTSHAAVVARGLGRTCVVAAEGLTVDVARGTVTLPDRSVLHEGEVVSVDGMTGQVLRGRVPVVPSPLRELDGSGAADELLPPSEQSDDTRLRTAVRRLLAHADRRAIVQVRANADVGNDAERARAAGAHGVGLCRTEHTLLGERRQVVEDLVLGHDRAKALTELLRLHRQDVSDVLLAMDGFPVAIRLLDPPLHEFLPDPDEVLRQAAAAEAAGEDASSLRERAAAILKWQETNPMLGLRGIRLRAVVPDLYATQIRAIVEAAAELHAAGHDPHPEVLLPFVVDLTEVEAAREELHAVEQEVFDRRGFRLPDFPLGVMIELPRAAALAGELAPAVSFFSFGTNDLTQTTWGLSRDDAERVLLPAYLSAGLLPADPFRSLDAKGVGRLIRMAVDEGRGACPQLELGACGEHAGDPSSIATLCDLGVDYVSCSPSRVLIARLEVGRAAVGAHADATT